MSLFGEGQKNRCKYSRFAVLKVSPNTYNNTNGKLAPIKARAFTSYFGYYVSVKFGEFLRTLGP